MKLKDLMGRYGEYEVDSKIVTGECEIERIVIDLTKPKPKTVWDLKSRDKCWTLDEAGGIAHERYGDGLFNDERREFGNVFLTEKEAKKDLERRKVETLLLKYGGRRRFKYDIANWVIRYNHLTNSFEYGYTKCTQFPSCIYFDTKEKAEKAIQEIGADRVFKALFEVR